MNTYKETSAKERIAQLEDWIITLNRVREALKRTCLKKKN